MTLHPLVDGLAKILWFTCCPKKIKYFSSILRENPFLCMSNKNKAIKRMIEIKKKI